MKKLKVFIVATLIIAMPMSQARAVVPDMNSVISDVVESTGITDLHISGAGSQHVNLAQVLAPSQDSPKLPAAALPSSIVIQETPTTEELDTQDQNDNEDLVGGLALPGHHFWTTRKLVITSTLLLTTGLLVGLLLMLSSGGSSSGSGAGNAGGGGGGGGGNNPPPNDPNNGPPQNANKDPKVVDPPVDPDVVPYVPPPIIPPVVDPDLDIIDPIIDPILPDNQLPPGNNIPHHPEPSTFLLMGLGLLVPMLRKRGLL